MHAEAPACENEPGLQTLQAPPLDAKVPAEHSEQEVAPAPEKSPGEQGAQVAFDVAPVADEDVPAGQLEQLAAPGRF